MQQFAFTIFGVGVGAYVRIPARWKLVRGEERGKWENSFRKMDPLTVVRTWEVHKFPFQLSVIICDDYANAAITKSSQRQRQTLDFYDLALIAASFFTLSTSSYDTELCAAPWEKMNRTKTPKHKHRIKFNFRFSRRAPPSKRLLLVYEKLRKRARQNDEKMKTEKRRRRKFIVLILCQ